MEMIFWLVAMGMIIFLVAAITILFSETTAMIICMVIRASEIFRLRSWIICPMSFRASTPFVVAPAMTELWVVATTIIYTAAWGMTKSGAIMAITKQQNALLVMMRFGETKAKIRFMAVTARIPYMVARMMTGDMGRGWYGLPLW